MRYYIIIILLGSLAFSNSLQNSFVWDDYGLISENSDVNLPLEKIYVLFARPLWNMPDSVSAYYRPLVNLLLVLNYKLWGPNPAGFHAVNLVLHLGVCLILFEVGKLLFANERNRELIALVAACIFAVHPVSNEHIGRPFSGEFLLGFFVLLTIWYFLKEKKLFSVLIFALALLTKETAVMLPFALAVISVRKEGLRKGLGAIVPYMAVTGMYLVIRMFTVHSVLGDVFIWSSIRVRVITMVVATFDYLKLLVLPWPLSPFYPARTYTTVFDPRVLAALAVLLLVALLAVRVRKNTSALFLVLFPFFMLAPVILKVNTMGAGRDFMYIAERYLYLPSAAFALLVSALTVKSFERTSFFPGGVILTLCAVTMILLPITLYANRIWKDNIALYGRITADSPGVAFAHHGLGDSYRDLGRLDLALIEWEQALLRDPGNPLLLNSVGNCYALLGDYSRAIEAYRTAIRVYPKHIESYYNLAIALEKSGKQAEADEFYRKFMKIAPVQYHDIVEGLRQRGLSP